MKLQGILDNSLGGFICVRGFADFGDLAEISAPNPRFQRDLITQQSERIREFLKNRQYLFFPEIVLSYTLKYNYNLPGAISGIVPLQEILERRTFFSNVDKIKFWSQQKGMHKVTIGINDKFLKTIKPFDRIDGNHRLSAAFLEPEFKKYNTPFCLILLDDDLESEAKKRVIFHNINYKSIPLTPEENYKLIIDEDNKEIFTDDTLKEDLREFGWEFYIARKLFLRIDAHQFPFFEKSFTKFDDAGKDYTVIRTFLIDLLKELLSHKLIEESEISIDKTFSEIAFAHGVYKETPALQEGENPSLIISFIYYHLTNDLEKLFKPFKHWVLANKIHEQEELTAGEIITLFSKRMEARKGDVFISMDFQPYFDNHYKCIKEAVEEFRSKHKRATEIRELRMDKVRQGGSFNIYNEMNKMIENSSLLIADLSNGNKNVYNEVGYLMGLNKGRGATINNFILIMQENVSNELVGFNLKPYQRIRFENAKDLKKELIKSLEIHFGLGPQES